MAAPVVRWQMLSSRPDEVSRFYCNVFGWTATRDNALGYREISTGSNAGIAGGIWPAPPEAPSFVQLFVEIDDIDATISAVLANGGSVLVPKSVLPDGDTMAIVKDSVGMSIGLILSR
jgi:predicted enzyme related to lactoylglutathione lyase